MCAAGSNLLGSNVWSMGPDGDSETAGDCYTTRQACEGAGYRQDDDDESSLVVKCESEDGRMTRTTCHAIAGASYWDITTCQAGQSHLAHFRAHPEAIATYCSNPMYREWLGAAMMRCCEGGNSNSVDSLCGDITVSPSPPPVSLAAYTGIGGTVGIYTDSECGCS